MNKQKHHYVPRSYLIQFTKGLDGKFFSAGPKSEHFRTIKRKHIAEVCYVNNFYTLMKAESLEKYSLDDGNFIEKNAFNYEKHRIRQVIYKFKNRNVSLNKSYHDQLIEIYLSIKIRNVFLRNQHLDKKIINETLDKEILKFIPYKTWIEKVSGEKYEDLMERVRDTLANDKVQHEEFQKLSIIESIKGTNEPINQAKRKIRRLNIFLFEPLNEEDYFITSDNPGFTLIGNKVYNTNFGDFDSIGFPINSRQLVMFMGQSPQSELEVLRRINYMKLTSKEIDILNACTTFNAVGYIFCESKKYLEEFKVRFLEEYGS